ncbi:MAG: M23 family metallopeptidase [Dysgonamonadaceae bacterium]|jgi:murein DD-endopeptidase MepM/ murein hydrolase activator NlpD|nr:M23 family metallopeptidase [Dysgonamonadaceae bacterium]
MSNIFYQYNPQTLNYERVYPTRRQRLWAICRQLLIGIVIGGAIFGVVNYAFDSPSEAQLKKENKLLLTQYQVLSKRLNKNLKVLEDLQNRDNDLYRVLFNAEPIPESIRHPGIGGTDRYESLLSLSHSNLVIETTRKLDIMSRELYVQSNSYDELAQLVKTKEERIKHIPTMMPLKDKDLKRIASGFGMRLHPIYGSMRMHTGLDMNGEIGTPIYATGDGIVVSCGYDGGYGNCVLIDHGFGYKTRYGHCKDLLVRAGQKVSRGDKIATIGMTGATTGPHLHYEVLLKDHPDNPAKYFFMDLNPQEYEQALYLSENQ